MMVFNQFLRKIFGEDAVFVLNEQRCCQFGYPFGVKSRLFRLVGSVVKWEEVVGDVGLVFGGWVNDFGVADVPAVVKKGGLPENGDVAVALFQHVLNPFDAVEPHQFDGAGAVGELCRKPFGALFAQDLVAGDIALEEHVVAFRLDVADLIDGGFVHVPEGEVVEQVVVGEDAELATEHLGPLRADAFQVLNRCF